MKINYIIVDDETAAHEIITEYASHLPFLIHAKSCYNAFEALDYLRGHQVDLVFLDINMPKLSGFDLLKTLSDPPRVIVTSAHKDFALEGYELNIDDYLLKPFNLDRFLKAIDKIGKTFETGIEGTSQQSIFIKDNKRHYQVKINDILFVQAFGNYVKIHLYDEVLITHQTLTALESTLSSPQFIRSHKSYLVAKDKISLIEGNRIFIGEHEIPIGKTYRETIERMLF